MKYPILLPSQKELRHGRRYLAFETVFLGYFLRLFVSLFELGWDSARLNLTFFCLNFAVTVVLFRFFLKKSACAAVKRVPIILATVVVGFFVCYGLTTLVGMAIVALEPAFFNVNNKNLSSISQQHYWLTTVCTIFLVPVTEELLHRGAVFGGLRRTSRVLAYGVSTAVFAMVHISTYIGHYEPRILLLCYLQYIPAGLCLAASYDLTGSIVTPILIHAVINAVGTLAMR